MNFLALLNYVNDYSWLIHCFYFQSINKNKLINSQFSAFIQSANIGAMNSYLAYIILDCLVWGDLWRWDSDIKIESNF